MPRTRLDKQPDPLVALLWGQMEAQGRKRGEMAKVAGMSDDTLRRRKAHPEEFTLKEIASLCRSMHIPVDDLRGAIRL